MDVDYVNERISLVKYFIIVNERIFMCNQNENELLKPMYFHPTQARDYP